MKIKDMTGRQFGRLTVLQRVEDHVYPNGRHDIQYLCRCDCGKELVALGIHLRSGHTSSCGCARAEAARNTMTTHGMTNTRLHDIWKNMKERCLNENHKNYDIYGGRGITISDEWIRSFETFYQWSVSHGYNDSLTLDRVDVDTGYTPDNCRWVSQKEQCNNTRRNIVVRIGDETRTLKQWTELLGLKYCTIVSRVRRGWDPVKALTAPVRSIGEHH